MPEILCVGEDYFVAAWHPAAPDLDGEHEPDREWAVTAGAGLATLHAETAPELDGYGQFHVDDGLAVTGHGDWQAGAVEYVRSYRETLEGHGHGDVLETVLDALATHPELFDGVDAAVCCHGWATPEHVAVEEEQVGCMVDFEHAVAAPGESDYWRTVFPALGGKDSEDTRRAFRTGYPLSAHCLPVWSADARCTVC